MAGSTEDNSFNFPERIAEVSREIIVDSIWIQAIRAVLEKRDRARKPKLQTRNPWGLVTNLFSGIMQIVDGERHFKFELFTDRVVAKMHVNQANRDLIAVIAKEGRISPFIEPFHLSQLTNGDLKIKAEQLREAQEEHARELDGMLWAMPAMLEAFHSENIKFIALDPMRHIERILNEACDEIGTESAKPKEPPTLLISSQEMMLSHGYLPLTHNVGIVSEPAVKPDHNSIGKPSGHFQIQRDIKKLSAELQSVDTDWITAGAAYEVLASAAYIRAITEVRMMKDRRELSELFVVAGEVFLMSDRASVDAERVMAKAVSLREHFKLHRLHAVSNGKLRAYQDRLLENFDGAAKTLSQLVAKSNGLPTAHDLLSQPHQAIDLAFATLDDLGVRAVIAKPESPSITRGLTD